MLPSELIEDLKARLAISLAVDRKRWAKRIIRDEIPIARLFGLLHEPGKTPERFTWLLGDLVELGPELLVDSMPFLFDLKDQVKFPGITRSIAKWLWKTGIPQNVQDRAIPQLLQWVSDDESPVACKSYAALALLTLVKQQRLGLDQAQNALVSQFNHPNQAYRRRIQKLAQKLTTVVSND